MVDLDLIFDVDLHKTKADGKVHDLTTYASVKYNGSLGTCSSASGSGEFTNDGAAASIEYYVPRKFEVVLNPSRFRWTISYFDESVRTYM